MVDVSEKGVTARSARAEAFVRMSPATRNGRCRMPTLPKGDAFVARATGRDHGGKAHRRRSFRWPIRCRFRAWKSPLSGPPAGRCAVEAQARTAARTGVEMEAMVAAAVAALTIYDMCKALDKGIADRVGSAAREDRRQKRRLVACGRRP